MSRAEIEVLRLAVPEEFFRTALARAAPMSQCTTERFRRTSPWRDGSQRRDSLVIGR